MRVAFVRHDPFGPVLAGFFRPAFRPVGATAQPKAEAEALPAPVDVVDKGDRFVVKVDLPGVGKEEINVAVDGTRVSVNATARINKMAEYIARHTTVEWLERLDAADVPCAPILRRGERTTPAGGEVG